MTSPNQTPDALREAIRATFDAESYPSWIPSGRHLDRLLTAIAPFLAPPLTPDASPTTTPPPPSQGAEGRTPRAIELKHTSTNIHNVATAYQAAFAELAQAYTDLEAASSLEHEAHVELAGYNDLKAQLASARAELAEAKAKLSQLKASTDYAISEKDKHGRYWHDLAQERIVAHSRMVTERDNWRDTAKRTDADLTSLRAQVEEGRNLLDHERTAKETARAANTEAEQILRSFVTNGNADDLLSLCRRAASGINSRHARSAAKEAT